jgi:hypothetical protein
MKVDSPWGVDRSGSSIIIKRYYSYRVYCRVAILIVNHRYIVNMLRPYINIHINRIDTLAAGGSQEYEYTSVCTCY